MEISEEPFGEDPMMLMQKQNAPVDLNKPILIVNNTTGGGIVHAIDGTGKVKGASYATNDMNLLPASVTNSSSAMKDGGAWLGGV